MDIARNPGLAKAAKAELDGESRSASTHFDPNAFPREADVRMHSHMSTSVFVLLSSLAWIWVRVKFCGILLQMLQRI